MDHDNDFEDEHGRAPRRRRNESDGFVCRNCRRTVDGRGTGTRFRNHCPHCLWSVHVDIRPGDRLQSCGGSMEPIAVWVKRDGEWALVHRCATCGSLRTNRVAGDDSAWAMMSLAAKPLAQPPFPLGI